MSAPLVLVGASGLAREVLSSLDAETRAGVRGFLDDATTLQGVTMSGVPVLGRLTQVVQHGDARLLVCVGNGLRRRLLVHRLAALGVVPARYATVIHPSAVVPASCSVGRGSILLAHTVLTADAIVGRHVVAMPSVTITHDDQVADFVTLCAGTTLGGGVLVGEGAYLGMNSSVREQTTVGAGSVLGMGAVLTRDLPAGETWIGSPARRLERVPTTLLPTPAGAEGLTG